MDEVRKESLIQCNAPSLEIFTLGFSSVAPVTYSNRILPPPVLLSHSSVNPPMWTKPVMMMATLDSTMTTPCKKSVHTTAFIPPCTSEACETKLRCY